MGITKLSQRAVQAVRAAVNTSRQQRKHDREGRREPQLTGKELQREIAINRENSRRAAGGGIG